MGDMAGSDITGAETATTGSESGGASIAAERRRLVDRAREAWIARLIDMSRRNNLLYFRELKTGTLDLSAATPDDMRRLLQSARPGASAVPLQKLVTSERLDEATASLRTIGDRARANFEERGLDTLFLALGFAAWNVGDGGRDACAPVLFLPLAIEKQGTRGQTVALRRSGEIKANDVLLHALHVEHGVTLDGDTLIPAILGDDDGEEFDLQPVFDRLADAARSVPGFTIQPRWFVGNFSFQKLAIVRDLKDLGPQLASHDLIAGIAGDAQAREQARGSRSSIEPCEFDQHGPDTEFLVLDADSSQQQAIAMTTAGQNLVVSGPPGTGKSQTIANLIAELTASGRTVLFVAEKRAALDVVLNRLRRVRLDHLCLDLHGADISRKLVARQLQQSLDEVREAMAPDATDLHARFVERRKRLNEHVRQMHASRSPSGLSVYQMYGQLARLPDDARCATRFSPETLEALDAAARAKCLDLLREASGLHALVLGVSPSAWTGARFTDAESVRAALERATRLRDELWRACERAVGRALTDAGVSPRGTMAGLRQAVAALERVDSVLAGVSPEIFSKDLTRLESALLPAGAAWSRLSATFFDAGYRRTLKEVRALANEKLSAVAVLDVVRRTADALRAWSALGADGPPRGRVTGIDAAVAALNVAVREASATAGLFGDLKFDEWSPSRFGEWVTALAADRQAPVELLRVHELASALAGAGAGPVLDEIRKIRPRPERWPDVFRHAWLSSCLEDVRLREPAIAGFNGRPHDDIVREFKELDRQRLEVAIERVRRAHAEGAVAVRNRRNDQDSLVVREAQKRGRHLPFRQLVQQAPDVLLGLRPCWMASPLSVSQLLPGDRQYFDVVIFDEASQVLPEDAITSLLRGRRAVVAGDRRQLPPTTFFTAGDGEGDEIEEEAATAGFESILDVMSAFLDPPASLDWHYRSRDEALIAFSNHQIYDHRLVTFPGPGRWPALTHVMVPFVPGQGGQEESAALEVDRVVKLVIEHARQRPNETLGVIAMGITHASRVQMALERALADHPDLDEFFRADAAERFFVKNLERVQGDERDAIILTIGYGKNEAGRLVYRFGPLLQEGGERRLNVAITRARVRMTVVSSFSHVDVAADYPKAGVRLLRSYLEYAASGGTRLDTGAVTDVPLNDFEQSVCDELVRRGFKVMGQLGSSRYRIDLVVMHPQKPGRFVLAIECDGASYHSAPTARDRDRLRQQQLEELGWRFHRIWSTDWFYRREDEIARTVRAVEEAVCVADQQDAAQAADNGGGAFVPTPVEDPAPPPPEVPPAPPVRGPRPPIVPGWTISKYSSSQLEQLVAWVLSDGLLRTDDELLTETMTELSFRRRGPLIVAALNAAIAAVRRQERTGV